MVSGARQRVLNLAKKAAAQAEEEDDDDDDDDGGYEDVFDGDMPGDDDRWGGSQQGFA